MRFRAQAGRVDTGSMSLFVLGDGSREFGFELCWRRARREKRRLLFEVEALLDADCGDDVLGCLGELHREWRRVGPAGPGHEQYLWACFKEAASEIRRHAVWLEDRAGVGVGGGRGSVIGTRAGSRGSGGVSGSVAMGKGA
jgi:hypothetical protein